MQKTLLSTFLPDFALNSLFIEDPKVHESNYFWAQAVDLLRTSVLEILNFIMLIKITILLLLCLDCCKVLEHIPHFSLSNHFVN